MADNGNYLSGQPSGGGDQAPSGNFLGVPKDYLAIRRDPTTLSGVRRPDSLDPALQAVPPTYVSGSEFDITRLSVENIARLQARLSAAGLIGPSTKFRVGIADSTTISAYKRALETANRYGMSVVEAMDMLASTPQSSGGDLSVGGDGKVKVAGPASLARTTTRTDRNVTTFTAADAETAADDAYRQALGQEATPAQQKALRAALNAYAKANPSVSTTESRYNRNGEMVRSSTTSSGGMDASAVQQIAQDQARANPSYAEVQAATTYWNALEQSLGATANV